MPYNNILCLCGETIESLDLWRRCGTRIVPLKTPRRTVSQAASIELPDPFLGMP